jgi:hypothetical protein
MGVSIISVDKGKHSFNSHGRDISRTGIEPVTVR